MLCAGVTGGCSGSSVIQGQPSASRPTTSAPPPIVGRPAHLADPGRAHTIETDAAADVVAVDSYDYRSLERDLHRGLAHSTGAFAQRYRAAYTGTIEPAAKRAHAAQRVSVAASAVASVHGTRALLLVAGRLRTTSRTGGAKTVGFLAQVAVTEHSGQWLVTSVRTGLRKANIVLPQAGPGLITAQLTVGRGVHDLLNISRAHFARDYAHLLRLCTGSLRQSLTAAESQARSGVAHADSTGYVDQIATVSASGRRAVLLAAAYSRPFTSPTVHHRAVQHAYLVTVVLSGRRWLLSDLRDVETS